MPHKNLLLIVLAAVFISSSCAEPLPPPTPTSAQQEIAEVRVAQYPNEDNEAIEAARIYPIVGDVRLAIMTDKPLYRLGQTIKFRIDARHDQGRHGVGTGTARIELIDPRDRRTAKLEAPIRFGVASGAFQIPTSAPGGTYRLAVRFSNQTIERELTVATYRADKLNKKLEFRRRGYAPGAPMTVDVRFARTTGEPLSAAKVSAQLLIGDTAGEIVHAKTGPDGKAALIISLPKHLADKPVLAVSASDGGVLETIARPVPVLTGTPTLTLHPEGGSLVAGLPGRVFFKVVDTFGDPVDVRGSVIDDRNRIVTTFESTRDGYGVFAITPQRGRSYRAKLQRSQKAEATLVSHNTGCSLRPVESKRADSEIRIAVTCTRAQKLSVKVSSLDRTRWQHGTTAVAANKRTLMTLPVKAALEGLALIEIHDAEDQLVARQTVFRTGRSRMSVAITASEESIAPGGSNALHIETRDSSGSLIPASLGIAVVDEAVLAKADDKQPNLFVQTYLGNLNLERLPDPNSYLDESPESRTALAAMLGAETFRAIAEPYESIILGGSGIAGTVSERKDGSPITGATVVANSSTLQGYRGAISDAKGRFIVPDLPPGTYRLDVYYADYTLSRERIVVKKDRFSKLTFRFDSSTAGESIAIQGTTIDRDYIQNQPIPGRDFEAALATAGGTADGPGVSFAGSSALENKYVADGIQTSAVGYTTAPSAPKAKEGQRSRTRFIETIYWHPNVRTDRAGRATIEVTTGDSITSYRATAQGFATSGASGIGTTKFAAVKPLSIEAVLPAHAQSGDELRPRLTVVNRTDKTQRATVGVRSRGLRQLTHRQQKIVLQPGERTTLTAKAIASRVGSAAIEFTVAAGTHRDHLVRKLEIHETGYPQAVTHSGTLAKSMTLSVEMPSADRGVVPGSVTTELQLFPSLVSQMTSGTEEILREPSGCFEQTSSASYPNLMALALLRAAGKTNQEFEDKALPMLRRGYEKLVGYESKSGGFEWFGADPGHEALTAYGLLQFHDMHNLTNFVDQQMIVRTTRWLLSRRDRRGGFLQSQAGLDSFGGVSQDAANAYIVWALAEIGAATKIERELRALERRSIRSSDPYVVALATAAVSAAGRDSGALAEKLLRMQSGDGSFPGSKTSITSSRGHTLLVETTALAAYALIGAKVSRGVPTAIAWIGKNRSGAGWGSTQSTVLALKALAAYGTNSASSGLVRVRVNGGKPRAMRWKANGSRPVALRVDDTRLKPGSNRVEIESNNSVPFSLGVRYRQREQPDAKPTPVEVSTRLSKSEIRLGQALTMRVTVNNLEKTSVPMTLVRVGIPAGLEVETKQLESLRDRKVVDFVETRPREVTLYFRGLNAAESKIVDIALVATIEGSVTGPPSSAALYYTPEETAWSPPLRARIGR